MDIVLLGHHKKYTLDGTQHDYVFPLQEMLMTVLYLKAKVTLRITKDCNLKDEVFGELPYFIFQADNGGAKFITRDNIPKFMKTCTTINDWMTDKQKKACEWIEHYILDLDPSFKTPPDCKPNGFNLFRSKFYRISSVYLEYEAHQKILQILNDKLADGTYFYSEEKLCTLDILAYYWLKQKLLNEKLSDYVAENEGIQHNFPKLVDFVTRMSIIFKNLESEVSKYKNSYDPTLNIDPQIELPEQMAHFTWKDESTLLPALEEFKQRDALLLEGKVKYSRANTYLAEPRKKRYKRLLVSVSLLALFCKYAPKRLFSTNY
ncbi:unnamed protein product [Moneuplotes crassus]|uniref:Uncharacterized protein n=1 Tax=Euplotes crassus TaxID=5936 RepID=A0AAD1XMU0_EUPCR|nr:unnamed protein product [Moneuplotes crassus]